jgi:hypothetical protein
MSSKKRPKREVKDVTIKEIFAVRDELLAKAVTDDAKKEIHMACKGLFGCPKDPKEEGKKKCFEGIKAKLTALGGVFPKAKKGGGRARSRSRSRGKAKRSKSKRR